MLASLAAPVRALVAALALALLGAPRVARAAEDGVVRAGEGPHVPPRKKVLVTVDALATVSQRYGVRAEWAFAPRTSVTFNPWFSLSTSRGTADLFDIWGDDGYSRNTDTHAAGLDAQLRYYTGDVHGNGDPAGFFLAPGLVVQHFATVSTVTPPDTAVDPPRLPPVTQAWSYVGPSFEMGWQVVTEGGFVLSGSVGGMYRVALGEQRVDAFSGSWMLYNGPGLCPRLSLAIGGAF
jgi:hypothetical protein